MCYVYVHTCNRNESLINKIKKINIAIKIQKDIDNFEPWVSMTNQGKHLIKLNPKYVRVFKSLPWLVN